MYSGSQNFLDRILDKRATYGETIILSVIIGFCIYYFLGDITTLQNEGKFVLVVLGFPVLAVIRKIYWTFRMKNFLLKNSYVLKSEREPFLRYYRTHAFRNIYYYYGLIQAEEGSFGWSCPRCGAFNKDELTRCDKCTQRKNKPVEF